VWAIGLEDPGGNEPIDRRLDRIDDEDRANGGLAGEAPPGGGVRVRCQGEGGECDATVGNAAVAGSGWECEVLGL
jgi:hypothetical protein